jgi:hypothetical protein
MISRPRNLGTETGTLLDVPSDHAGESNGRAASAEMAPLRHFPSMGIGGAGVPTRGPRSQYRNVISTYP